METKKINALECACVGLFTHCPLSLFLCKQSGLGYSTKESSSSDLGIGTVTPKSLLNHHSEWLVFFYPPGFVQS